MASVTELPFRNDMFNLVISSDVLEHVQEKKLAINEAYRVCNSSAFFIGSTTNLMNPILFIDSYFGFLTKPIISKFKVEQQYDRHKRWSYARLYRLLEKQGFSCDIHVIGFPPFDAAPYQYSNKKVPIYAYFWIIFDEIGSCTLLKLLKETLFFVARKDKQPCN